MKPLKPTQLHSFWVSQLPFEGASPSWYCSLAGAAEKLFLRQFAGGAERRASVFPFARGNSSVCIVHRGRTKPAGSRFKVVPTPSGETTLARAEREINEVQASIYYRLPARGVCEVSPDSGPRLVFRPLFGFFYPSPIKLFLTLFLAVRIVHSPTFPLMRSVKHPGGGAPRQRRACHDCSCLQPLQHGVKTDGATISEELKG